MTCASPLPLAKRRPFHLYPISRLPCTFGYRTETPFMGAAHGEEHPLARRQGNYKRDLGWTAEGKQPRFYLGRDKAQAEKRALKLERLWELVEARWESLRQRHAILEEKWRQEVE